MASFLSIASGVGSILGGLGGLFGGKKPKERWPHESMRSIARGAREASQKYGFNPLTMISQGGSAAAGFAGQRPGEPAPLASIDLITSGLAGLDDVASGDAARRRRAEEVELELARIQLDRARAGLVQPVAGAVDRIGSQPAVFGRTQTATYSQPNVAPVSTPRMASTTPRMASTGGPARAGGNPHAPDREVERDPVVNTGYITEIDNKYTLGPVSVPGSDGAPAEIDELATFAIFGAPQIAGRWVRKAVGDMYGPEGRAKAKASIQEQRDRKAEEKAAEEAARPKEPLTRRPGESHDEWIKRLRANSKRDAN